MAGSLEIFVPTCAYDLDQAAILEHQRGIPVAAGLGRDALARPQPGVAAHTAVRIAGRAEIESVARQPEMKDELQSIRWLGFALTEAVAFYTFIFGLIAFFL